MDLSTHVQHPLPNLSVRKVTLLQRRGVGNWWRKIRSMPSNMIPSGKCGEFPLLHHNTPHFAGHGDLRSGEHFLIFFQL